MLCFCTHVMMDIATGILYMLFGTYRIVCFANYCGRVVGNYNLEQNISCLMLFVTKTSSRWSCWTFHTFVVLLHPHSCSIFFSFFPQMKAWYSLALIYLYVISSLLSPLAVLTVDFMVYSISWLLLSSIRVVCDNHFSI